MIGILAACRMAQAANFIQLYVKFYNDFRQLDSLAAVPIKIIL